MTTIKRITPKLATLLPRDIASALQSAWLDEDPEEIARVTEQAKKTHPEFWRDESDGKFPDPREAR